MTKPKFSTRIDASGPSGNVFVVLGTATHLMRELGCGKTEVEGLRSRVMAARNYNDAIDAIREWFPVRIGK